MVLCVYTDVNVEEGATPTVICRPRPPLSVPPNRAAPVSLYVSSEGRADYSVISRKIGKMLVVCTFLLGFLSMLSPLNVIS